jgi:hypothetical protein
MSAFSYRVEHRALVIAVSCAISVSHALVAWMTQAIPSARSMVVDTSNRSPRLPHRRCFVHLL